MPPPIIGGGGGMPPPIIGGGGGMPPPIIGGGGIPWVGGGGGGPCVVAGVPEPKILLPFSPPKSPIPATLDLTFAWKERSSLLISSFPRSSSVSMFLHFPQNCNFDSSFLAKGFFFKSSPVDLGAFFNCSSREAILAWSFVISSPCSSKYFKESFFTESASSVYIFTRSRRIFVFSNPSGSFSSLLADFTILILVCLLFTNWMAIGFE